MRFPYQSASSRFDPRHGLLFAFWRLGISPTLRVHSWRPPFACPASSTISRMGLRKSGERQLTILAWSAELAFVLMPVSTMPQNPTFSLTKIISTFRPIKSGSRSKMSSLEMALPPKPASFMR